MVLHHPPVQGKVQTQGCPSNREIWWHTHSETVVIFWMPYNLLTRSAFLPAALDEAMGSAGAKDGAESDKAAANHSRSSACRIGWKSRSEPEKRHAGKSRAAV